MKKLENKVALVTSATRGIGLASALKLAESGATVYMGVRRLEVTQEICDEYAQKGYKMFPVFFDAYQSESYKTMVEEVVQKEGRLDILVNNFGTSSPKDDLDLVNTQEDYFFDMFKANVGTIFSISKLAIPHMIKGGVGSIVNISSIGGTTPDVTRIAYGVTKSGVNNITQQIAMQYARQNIRCNAVLPGFTATDAALDNMPEEFIKSFLSHVPLNRAGKPEDMANAVLFFASEDSSYVTGNIMEVAGGYGIGTPQYADTIRSL
ncbi:MAG: SDR family oxidoreductase [Peptostreptococcaceae bacterium]